MTSWFTAPILRLFAPCFGRHAAAAQMPGTNPPATRDIQPSPSSGAARRPAEGALPAPPSLWRRLIDTVLPDFCRAPSQVMPWTVGLPPQRWPQQVDQLLRHTAKMQPEQHQRALFDALQQAAAEPEALQHFMSAALRRTQLSEPFLGALHQVLAQLPPDDLPARIRAALRGLPKPTEPGRRPDDAGVRGQALAVLASALARVPEQRIKELFDELYACTRPLPPHAATPAWTALAGLLGPLQPHEQRARFEQLLENAGRVADSVASAALDVTLLATLAGQLPTLSREQGKGRDWRASAMERILRILEPGLQRLDCLQLSEASLGQLAAGLSVLSPSQQLDPFERLVTTAKYARTPVNGTDASGWATRALVGALGKLDRRKQPWCAFYLACTMGLRDADLRGVNLNGARLLRARGDLCGAQFDASGIAELVREVEQFDPATWVRGEPGRDDKLSVPAEMVRDRMFDHRANRRSVLLTIDSISPEYDDQKLRMMEMLVDKLERARTEHGATDRDLVNVYPAFTDILGRNPLYLGRSAAIRKFAHRRGLLEKEMTRFGQSLIAPSEVKASSLHMMLTYIDGQLKEGGWAWAREHAIGIFQVLNLARDRPADSGENAAPPQQSLRDRAREIYQAYCAAVPDEGVKKLLQQQCELMAEDYLPVYSRAGDRVLLLSDDYFNDCARWKKGTKLPPWNTLMMLKPLDAEHRSDETVDGWELFHGVGEKLKLKPALDPGEELQGIPMLGRIHMEQQNADRMESLLDLMLPPEQARQALEARRMRRTEQKWTGDAEQVLLANHITRLLGAPQAQGSKPEHSRLDRGFWQQVTNINRTLLDTDGVMDPKKAAYFCRCCAALLTGLSSAYHMGTEDASPFALRQLAAAFLNEAQELDPVDLPQHQDCINRLFGLQKAFQCTAVLYGILLARLREQPQPGSGLQAIYNSLIPSAW